MVARASEVRRNYDVSNLWWMLDAGHLAVETEAQSQALSG